MGLLAFAVFATSLQAQDNTPTFTIGNKSVNVGEQVDLDVRVTNYENILSTTYSVLWDTTYLEYIGVDNIRFGSEDNNFGTNKVSEGRLSYIFLADNITEGVSLEDNTLFFTVSLAARDGTTGQVDTPIEFGGNVMEVADTSGLAIEVTYNDGVVSIMGPTSTSTISSLATQTKVEVMPNPFSGEARLKLHVAERDLGQWVLSDVSGRTLASGTEKLRAGEQILIIDKNHFTNTGTYIFTMKIGQESLTQQLYYVDP